MSLIFFALAALASTEAFAPEPFVRPIIRAPPVSAAKDVNAAAAGALATLLAGSVAFSPVPAQAFASMDAVPMAVAATEVREGIYKSYEVDVAPQAVDKAEGTFKTAKATAKGKNKYVGVLGVLIIGSFIIPMLQYFWYVKEE